jgi:ABC-type glycerol-3-phosphate transport system substrate-binding protein
MDVNSRALRVVVPFVAAAALAGCGGGKPATARTSISALGSQLYAAASAEESYRLESGAYTANAADLTAQGMKAEPGVTVTVVSADASRFCLRAGGVGKLFLYYDSARGRPGTDACS